MVPTSGQSQKRTYSADQHPLVLYNLAEQLADMAAVCDEETFVQAAERRALAVQKAYHAAELLPPRGIIIGRKSPKGLDAVIYPFTKECARQSIVECKLPESGKDDINEHHPLHHIEGAGIGYAAKYAYVGLLGCTMPTTRDDLAVAQTCCISIGYTEQQTDQIARLLRQEMTLGLVDTMTRHHIETSSHLYRVALMTLELAGELGYGAAEARTIAHGAILHDVGKLTVPQYILAKPGSLTEAEWRCVQGHTTFGEGMLHAFRRFKMDMAAEIAGNHHERFDGSGYPYKKNNGDIPEAANIVAAADVIDAITHSRAYKSAAGSSAGLKAVTEGSDDGRTKPSHFLPVVREAVVKRRSTLADICRTYPEEEGVRNAIPLELFHVFN